MENSDTRKFIRYAGLAIVSALVSLWLSSNFMLLCTGILSFMGGVFGANRLLNVPESRFNFFQMAPVIIVLASSSGILFSFMSLSFISSDLWEIAMIYAHLTTIDIILAQAYTNLFAVSLLIIGGKLSRSEIIHQIHRDVTACLHDQKRTVLLWLVLMLICQLYLYNAGVIVYGGKDLLQEGEPTHPLLAMITPLIPALPFVLAYYLRTYIMDGHWLSVLLFSSILGIELFWFFLFGRRSIIYFFIFSAAGLVHNIPLNFKHLLKNIIPILLTCFFALNVADTYHKMRSMYSFEGVQRMNIMDVLSSLQNVDDETYNKIRQTNLASRAAYSSLALGQFVNVFRTTNKPSLLGQVLASSILHATPSNFLVDKKTILVKESLYENAFSLRITDISETLYLESFIDFGWLGFLIYTPFLFGILYLLCSAVSKAQQPVISLFASCAFISLALSMIETDMITFLATIRTLFFYYLLSLFLRKPSARPIEYIPMDKSKPI